MPITITDEEFANARDSKAGLEALLTRTCALAVEDALRVLPSVVQSLVVQVATLKETSDKFYADNKDLAMHKDGIAALTEEFEAKNPGKELPDILKEVAVEARRRLKTFGSLAAVQSPKPELTTLDAELKNMFEV